MKLESSLFLRLFKGKIWVYAGLILIGFGFFNITFANIATAQEDITGATSSTDLGTLIIARLLLEAGPIVGGAVTIAALQHTINYFKNELPIGTNGVVI